MSSSIDVDEYECTILALEFKCRILVQHLENDMDINQDIMTLKAEKSILSSLAAFEYSHLDRTQATFPNLLLL
ncbi:hypothetical protein PanWU01x14_220910, partial [Parasponia andersonii]